MIVDKIKKRENNIKTNKKSNIDIPIGKWVKCDKCKEIIYKETLKENLNICPNCGHYFRMHIGRRLEQIIDIGTYKRFDLNIETINPLELEDYPKKLKTLNISNKILSERFHSSDISNPYKTAVYNEFWNDSYTKSKK